MARLGLAIHEFASTSDASRVGESKQVLVDAKAKPWHDGVDG